MQQKRLIIALVLSSSILFLWSYFYPAKPPENPPPVATASPSGSATPAPTQSPQSDETPTKTQATTSASPTPQNTAPQRLVTVRTPLYEIKFDSRGGEPISWILKKN